jgi:putative sugar O-methyltransferase
VNKEYFIKSLDSMSSHCWKNLNATPGEYWDNYAKLIYKQTKLSGDILKPSCFYAHAFSGAPYNGLISSADADISKFDRLLDIVQNQMIKVAYDKSVFDPMLRWLLQRKNSRYYKQITNQTYVALVHWGHELLRDHIEHYDITSPDIYGVDCVDLGSRKLSYTTLQKLRIFLTLKKAASSPARIILEIGSGVGELARIFLATKTCEKYIIIDIPPALAYAERLLSETFGDDQMSFWSKDRKKIDLGDKNICYFLTPDQIGEAPGFDLGINEGSFGEMTADIVQGYIQALKKKNFREFFSINQRLKKSNSLEIIGEKQYIDYFSPDYECILKASYSSTKPNIHLEEDVPGKQGYQLLHFHEAGLKA